MFGRHRVHLLWLFCRVEREGSRLTGGVLGQPWEAEGVTLDNVLYVEVWGFGQGPNFRDDMAVRNPDLVNEAFRQYAIDFGIERTGRVFQEEDVPLSIALNALFPVQQSEVWNKFRASVPKGPIIAHGMNNSSALLPMGRGLSEQQDYIKKTLDLIEKNTGVRPKGWTSPSVYFNADTFRACASNGIASTRWTRWIRITSRFYKRPKENSS